MTLNRKLVGLVLTSVLALGGVAVGAVASADTMPDVMELANVNGLWHTSWGSESCELTLNQSGNNVTGGYVTTGAPPGTVSGVMNGNVLTGRWADTSSSGGFRMVFSADGRSFVGTWGSGGSYEDGGDWNGRR